MMKRIAIALLLIIPFIHNSCKNDLELLDSYQEKIVCYGIISPDDTAHYVRVSKAFLGEGNALVFAQNEDSIQLDPQNMEVRITQLFNGNEMSYWILQPDTSIPREEGTFLWPNQIVYRGVFPVLTDGSTYRLTVTDLRTGYVVTSETHIVRDLVHNNPNVQSFLNFENAGSIGFYFHTPLYGKRYRLALRFYYDEQFIYDTTEVSTRYVDWVIGETESITNEGSENLVIGVVRTNFINMLANNVEVNPLVRRVSKKIDLIYTSASEDMVTYMNVQIANSSSSADLPQFSNVENGLGLFTSRNTTTIPNFHIDQDTQYELVTNSLLANLNFVR
jgi:hypothetical protein